MRAYHVAVRGFNFKLMTYQKVISAPLRHAHVFLHGLHVTICLSLDFYVSHGHVFPVKRPCFQGHRHIFSHTRLKIWSPCVLEHMAVWPGKHDHVTHIYPDRLWRANHVRTHAYVSKIGMCPLTNAYLTSMVARIILSI